jgi:hypothetical protein
MPHASCPMARTHFSTVDPRPARPLAPAGAHAARMLHRVRRAERMLLSYERTGWLDNTPSRVTGGPGAPKLPWPPGAPAACNTRTSWAAQRLASHPPPPPLPRPHGDQARRGAGPHHPVPRHQRLNARRTRGGGQSARARVHARRAPAAAAVLPVCFQRARCGGSWGGLWFVRPAGVAVALGGGWLLLKEGASAGFCRSQAVISVLCAAGRRLALAWRGHPSPVPATRSCLPACPPPGSTTSRFLLR